MIPAWSGTAVRDAERPFLEAGKGPALMAVAAHGLTLECVRALRESRGTVTGARVVLLAGTGNNGGDGLWAAAALRRRGAAVRVVATGDRLHEDGAAAAVAAGVRVESLETLGEEPAVELCLAADLVIDAVLGTGATGGLRGAFHGIVHRFNESVDSSAPPTRPAGTRDGRPVVVAVDVVSGVEADTGAAPGPVLAADRTVTFGGPKVAHLTAPGRWFAGAVRSVPIGIEDRLPVPAAIEVNDEDLAELWPRPTRSDHKYTRGVVGIVAGSLEYPGAALLCTRSAVAAGAGMVRYLGDEHTRSMVTLSTPEVVTGEAAPAEFHVQGWVAGPGATDDAGRGRIEEIIASRQPAVLDAGAICVVGQALADADLCPEQILTPHAGELVDLLTWCQAWGRTERVPGREEVEVAPGHWARVAADATRATILLKGSVTVVATPGAANAPVLVVANGSPWLATAGSGDCLAGVMGALLVNVVGNPGAFETRVRRRLAATPLSEPTRERLLTHFQGRGRWGLIAALAAALHGAASHQGGEGPSPCRPEQIRAVLTR